ncbi:hypothetical protein [Halomicrococcus sp. NG-SE-24]|uniref:hypothetical protein n=1 Tax=Halomicrococcus sp. NG-SE-24 TaxID=3436928 RepID=UPI003D999B5E
MDSDRLQELDESARSGIERLESMFEDSDSDSFETITAEAENLWEVVEEAGELLEEVDLRELSDAVDHADLTEAIDYEDLPEAMKGDVGEAVDLRGLLAAVKLRELWNSTDVREVWRESREFTEAVEEVGETMDDDSNGSSADEDDFLDVDADELGVSDRDEVPTVAYQTKLQTELADSVETFREKLLDTRNQLKQAREENELKQAERSRNQPDSRNPTAYSTVPSARPGTGNPAKFSTVPRETRHSTAPNFERVYGDRFEEDHDDE